VTGRPPGRDDLEPSWATRHRLRSCAAQGLPLRRAARKCPSSAGSARVSRRGRALPGGTVRTAPSAWPGAGGRAPRLAFLYSTGTDTPARTTPARPDLARLSPVRTSSPVDQRTLMGVGPLPRSRTRPCRCGRRATRRRARAGPAQPRHGYVPRCSPTGAAPSCSTQLRAPARVDRWTRRLLDDAGIFAGLRRRGDGRRGAGGGRRRRGRDRHPRADADGSTCPPAPDDPLDDVVDGSRSSTSAAS